MTWAAGIRDVLSRIISKRPFTGLFVAIVAGMALWGGFNWSLEVTNTESFCISCHEMEAFVYTEYKTSSHYANRTGVRASCPDCHVPREWIHKVARKVLASNEAYHWLIGSIDSREKFEAKRAELADSVWQDMAETDSRECRNCHRIGFMAEDRQDTSARLMHKLAEQWQMTCIDCHKGIAHRLPRDFDELALMDDLHKRMEKQQVDCGICHAGMAKPPAGEEW
ncbi:MAG: NapC/NirT family cytochrome c [Alphaproteobacteria bacterium]|jgi:cytochrome c-type protein NapC|nr:NapC/NirT family cytochrome c [Alphaproteobacteria bacterium]MDP6590948.1 NapC/NirT family cytochrome c [Alphaproteobacteria bacterium]MDP6818326.1 NapC/NirT family cytochrome c [Alphaproteobacteria bacterium]|tara:strand:- start:212 stop:883 length:672 start_codon:yes stop_codon:yes gene_type:complete